MQIKNVAVVFTVRNLERTRRFYRDAFGIELEALDGLLSTTIGTVELVFFEGEASRGTSPQFVFGLEEGGIDTLAERLASIGVEVVTPVSEAPGGWSVDFRDPDGHVLSLFQSAELPRRI